MQEADFAFESVVLLVVFDAVLFFNRGKAFPNRNVPSAFPNRVQECCSKIFTVKIAGIGVHIQYHSLRLIYCRFVIVSCEPITVLRVAHLGVAT